MAQPLSVLDLTYLYVYRFFNQEPTLNDIKSIAMDVSGLLSDGWTDKDLFKAIRESKTKVPVKHLINNRNKTNTNIIKQFKFYYHNQLRVMPQTEEVVVDNDGNIIEQKSEDYYLEMKASYTMDDLVDYYISMFQIKPEDINRARYAGAFGWFLKKYDLDIVLYMIDCYYSNMMSSDGVPKPKSPMDIGDCAEQARDILSAKKSEAVIRGCNKTVPRKRVLDFSNRK